MLHSPSTEELLSQTKNQQNIQLCVPAALAVLILSLVVVVMRWSKVPRRIQKEGKTARRLPAVGSLQSRKL